MTTRHFATGFAALLLVATPPALAQAPAPQPRPPDYWGPVVGNFKVEFLDKNNQPAGVGEFSFQPGPKQQYSALSSGLVRESVQTYLKRWECGGTRSGATIELQCDTYGYVSNFTYVTLQASGDGNTLRGWWSSEKDKRDGMVRMKRVLPVIESAEVLGDGETGLDYAKMKVAWSWRKENPHIRVRMRGTEMPIWADLHATPVVLVSIDDPNYLHILETNWLSVNDMKQRWQQGYLDVVFALAPDAKPGRKVITINGVRKEFDVVLLNYRDEGAATAKLQGLRYVELKDGKFTPVQGELKHGATFYVEAAFDNKPAQAEYTVKLSWGAGPGADVRVKPAEDPKVFRSEPIRLQEPAANR